jgi:amino acid adenylation domain-containing protein
LPDPDAAERATNAVHVAPRTEVERTLARIWSEVLGTTDIGIHDNFFSLGGDSIRGVRVVALAGEHDLGFTVQQLFQAPTIAGLATILSEPAARHTPDILAFPLSLISHEDRSQLPAEIEDAYPVGAVQLGMLFHTEARNDIPSPPAYHNVNTFHMKFPFYFGFFQRAVNQVVARHPALRTSFDLVTFREPLQLVHKTGTVPVTVVDLRHLSEAEQNAECDAFIAHENFQLLDLSQPPLMRLCVHRLADDRVKLTLTEPHAVSDGWSTHLTLLEIFERYFALLGNSPSPDERPLAVTYRDFIRLEKEAIESEECRLFWLRKLSTHVRSTLPRTTHESSTQLQLADHKLYTEVAPEIVERLRVLASDAGVPFKSVLLAAHFKFMSLMMGESEIGTGLVVNGRPEVPGGDQVRGLFLNTVPVTVRLSAGTWIDLARQAHAAETEILPFRRYPLASIQRLWGHESLFDTVFSYHHFHSVTPALHAGRVEVLDGGSDLSRTNFPLGVVFAQDPIAPSRIVLMMEHDLNEFRPRQVESMRDSMMCVLETMGRYPAESHLRRSLLPSGELATLEVWRGTVHRVEARLGAELFEASAAARPDGVALEEPGGASISYGELDRRANRLAARLRGHGTGPEDVVGVYLEPSVDLVVAVLGILKAGGAYLPLDPSYPVHRVAFMLSDARPRVVLTRTGLLASLPAVMARILCVDRDEGEPASDPAGSLAPAGLAPDNLAYVIYTSGSSGTPKGVLVTHCGLANLVAAQAQAFGVGPGDRILQFASPSFDASVAELLMALASGATFCLGPRTPGAALEEVLEAGRITHVTLPPSALAVAEPRPLPELRTLIVAGEACPVELPRKWARGRQFFNAYGPTETTIWATGADVAGEVGPIPIGRPIQNVRVYVVDEQGQRVPVGVAGELLLGGVGLARGYLGRPDLTAEKFVPDSFGDEPGARLYRTGDRVRFAPNGALEFLGRRDGQVKLRGYRIELGEVEAALARYPGVGGAVVVVRGEALVAYVLAPEDGPAAVELRAYLREQLPDYMVPASYVRLDQWPLTPNGKIDRGALPAPGDDARIRGKGFLAPRTPTEELLAGIWGQLLNRHDVSARDNFFELGGHSLLAVQVMGRLREVFAVDPPLRLLFETPVLADLANRIDIVRDSGADLSRPPITRAPLDVPVRLSFAQRRQWFLHQLDPEISLYNMAAALRLRGRLDTEALRRGFTEILCRHEVLRTCFDDSNGEPVPIVHAPMDIDLPIIDLTELAAAERETRALELARQAAAQPLPLTSAPLLRCSLARLATDEHVLLFCMHHAAGDGWSMGVLVRELTALYQAFQRGLPSPLPRPPLQYSDFARWQREWLTGPTLDRQLAYWRQQLRGPLPTLELPTDHPRSNIQTYRGTTMTFTLSAELSAELAALSRHEHVTLFMTLLTAFAALLVRYSSCDDIVVGAPVANRTSPNLEELIGYFFNTLALRCEVPERLSFTEAVHRVRETVLDAFTHQDLPFELLVEELQPKRDPSRHPLFQVMFVFESAPTIALRLPEIEVKPFETGSRSAKFDLTLFISQTERGLNGAFEYNTDLFEAATISRMIEHFRTLLDCIARNPDRRLSEHSILTAAERAAFNQINATRVDRPVEDCLHRLIECQVARTPEAIAVVDDRCSLTFAEVNRRADMLAAQLRALGMGPEEVAGVCLERSVELVVSVLAVLKSGGAYLPLDPDYPADRLRFMLANARPRVVLGRDQTLKRLPKDVKSAHFLDPSTRENGQPVIADFPSADWHDHPAYVIYTSGSTGRPKGVVNTHRGICNRLLWMQDAYRLGASDSVLQKTPFSFDVSVWELFWPLMAGARLVMARPDGHRDPAYLVDVIEQRAITTLHFVPSMLRAFLRQPGLDRCRSVRQVICSGEALPFDLQERFFSRLGAELHNLYGPTEAAIDVTAWRCRPNKPVVIGRPIWNTRVYVVDGQGRQAPEGVAGELYLGGIGLARGYLGRPDLTAERFVPDGFGDEPGGRLYRTGDLARFRADGTLEFLGRRDGQVKLFGNRIELGEIEAALRQCSGVDNAAVIVRGESLVAYVIAPSDAPTNAELRAHLRTQLPGYMVPASYVRMDHWPLTPNGKLDRAALPAPEHAAEFGGEGFVAPRTPTEELLAGIWGQLLSQRDVGAHDDFFSLGGHSLLAIQVMGRMRQVFGVDLPLRSLFEMPVLSDLARQIDLARRSGAQLARAPIARVSGDVRFPLSFAQEPFWEMEQVVPGSPFYNMPVALRLSGPLDADALRRGFTEITRRHEVLRTSFAYSNGQPVQVVHAAMEIELPVTDLSGLPESDRESRARELAREAAAVPFLLTSAPLLRCFLLRLAESEHILLFCVHHAAADGWSMSVLLRELTALYNAFRQGLPSPLLEPRLQYGDFARWQRNWLCGPVLDAQLAYWRQQLQGPLAVLDLPTDHPRPASNFRSARASTMLSVPLWQAIQRFSHSEGATPFITVLAAFQLLLYRLSGQDDIRIATLVANRDYDYAEHLLGLFVNTVILRAKINRAATFREIVRHARTITLDAYDHQELPFEIVAKAQQIDLGVDRSSLCQVLLIFQENPIQDHDLSLPDLCVTPLEDSDRLFERGQTPTTFDLILEVARQPDGLAASITYKTSLFEPRTIQSMLAQLSDILRQGVMEPAG